MSGEGSLGITIWPVYIGAALVDSTPPFTISEPHDGGYGRGQIIWTPVPDARQVIGRARIMLPPGTYTHFLYFHHPTRPQACGVMQMDHPLVCTEPVTILDVDPIVNNDMQLARQL
jgi:hypothetical protein